MLPKSGSIAVISSSPLTPEALPAKKAQTLLGQETDAVVFDAHSGLDVNALAVISGTLRGGGTLFLLTPPLAEWPTFPDPAYQRFLPYPYQPTDVSGRFLQRLVRLLEQPPVQAAMPSPPPALTQQQAFEMMLPTKAPVVLTADRGRGKSAILGMAAAYWQQQGLNVLLTAPARATVISVFKHAGENAPTFIAPDELLQTLPTADILLVDEAAAIPVPLLLQMQAHYPRCVFATTVHGYEGSGRGFVLRFQTELQQRTNGQCMFLRLQQPIRWADNDPLEQFINQALLLDIDTPEAMNLPTLQAHYTLLDRDALAFDETLLKQVFGLLVTAHYQTRPSDLRQMLDAPDISIHVLRQAGYVLAVGLLSREGGLAAELTAAIHAGKRRPHGHPIPQTLTFHAGVAGAAELVCERVMRIAVQPALQGRGLGKRLLDYLKQYAQESGADYLGVSYAMTPQLITFWEQAGFQLARVGHRKDTASGSQSAVHIYPFTAAGQQLANQCTVQLTKPV